MLRGGRREAALLRQRNGGAIADGPHVGRRLAMQPVGHGDLPARLRQGQARQQRVRLDRHRRHDRPRGNRPAAAGRLVAHHRPTGGHGREPRVELDADAALHQHLVGELGQRGLHLRQDLLGALQQHQRQLVVRDRRVRAHGVPQKVVHLGDALDAGETAAGDDERQQPLPLGGIVGDGRLFQRVDQVIPQPQGVAQILERHGMLGEPRHQPRRQAIAQGEHEMVERQLVGPPQVAGLQPDDLPLEVDRLDAANVQRDAGDDAADRADHVERVEPAGDDLRQQRLEGEVVFLADQGHLDVVAAGVPQAAQQVLGRVHAGEAAAQDHDASGFVGHRRLAEGGRGAWNRQVLQISHKIARNP